MLFFMVRFFEVDDPPQQVFHHGGIEGVVKELALALNGDEVGAPEEVQVMRNAGFRHSEFLGDLAGGHRTVAQQLQNLAARGVAEGFENIIHLDN